MKSRAHLKSHPIHPMLVSFPIAFLVGALVFDASGTFGGWTSAWTVGAYLNLAGIVMGLVAAVPGVIDYLFAVPPNSSAKSRATKHMIVNVLALSAFALSWIFRDRPSLGPRTGALLLELLGVALLTSGGWLGGTLVYRNQIGVDHRYAESGKWREETIEGRAGQSIVAAKADELKVGQMKLIHVDGRRIVVARAAMGYVAFDDRCPHKGGPLSDGVMISLGVIEDSPAGAPHKGGPLSDGVMICGTVACPWHGSQFDAMTGAVQAGPAKSPVRSYPAEEKDGEVRVTI